MKETYFSNLKKALNLLTTEALAEEISKIEEQLREKIASGEKEEEAIQSLNDVEQVAKEIYLKRGIDPSKAMKKKGFFYRKMEELFESIHNVVDVMAKNTLQENAKIILDIIVLIVLLCVIKIPFLLVENIGDSFFQVFENNLITSIWGLVIDFAYLLVAIMVFMNIFTKWFHNIKSKKGEPKEKKNIEMPKPKIEGKELESVSLTDKVEKE